MHMRISSLFVDFKRNYLSVFQGSSRGGSQYELGGLVWEDVEGQESFPVSAEFELTTQSIYIYSVRAVVAWRLSCPLSPLSDLGTCGPDILHYYLFSPPHATALCSRPILPSVRVPVDGVYSFSINHIKFMFTLILIIRLFDHPWYEYQNDTFYSILMLPWARFVMRLLRTLHSPSILDNIQPLSNY